MPKSVIILAISLLLLTAWSRAEASGCQFVGDRAIHIFSEDDPGFRLGIGHYNNPVAAWARLSDQLEVYGNLFRDRNQRVVLWVKFNFGFEQVVVPYSTIKECGETLQQMASRISAAAAGGGSLVGGGGGGGGMYAPVIVRWTGWTFSCTIGGTPVSCEGF